ncbi:MAG: mechanosensitive ion channel family protein [Gammaproteobacteria bacterium]
MNNSLVTSIPWFTWSKLLALLKATILVLLGFIIAKTVSTLLAKSLANRVARHQRQLIRRIVFYVIFILFLIAALQHLGFQLSVLLGAAGVVTVALGIAAQTSVSNIISGFFLIAEQSFLLGDTITVNNVTGEVLSIDLLSIKIRTYDNTFVRIPNETLIKADIINLTRFPIRRFDIPIGIAYKEDLAKVREILLNTADKNPLCLEEPKPAVYILGFGASAINLQFSVWSSQRNFLDLKNAIQEDIKRALEENSIEIPFPQITLSASSITEPFPVQVK